MFIRFERMYERDRHTNRQTDGQTPHDDIGGTCMASRGKNDVRNDTPDMSLLGTTRE